MNGAPLFRRNAKAFDGRSDGQYGGYGTRSGGRGNQLQSQGNPTGSQGSPSGGWGRKQPAGTDNGQSDTGKAKYPNGVWIQFATPEAYAGAEMRLYELTAESDGNDPLVIFVKNPKGIKVLPPNRNVHWDEALKKSLCEAFGEENVRYRG